MKKRITASLLALLLSLSLVACEPPDLSDLISLDGSGKYDESFTPATVTEKVADTFLSSYSDQLSPNEAAIFDAISAAAPGQNRFDIVLPERIELCKGGNPTEAMLTDAQSKVTAWITNALAVVRLEAFLVFWLDTATFEYSLETAFTSSGICYIDDICLTVRLKAEMHLDKGFTARAGSDPVIERRLLDLKALVASLDLHSGNEVERVRRINSYLCERITYTMKETERDNVVGALLNGRAVCEGYANAFLYLCTLAGIPCVNIVGDGVTAERTEGHMWNAVRIEDKWYLVDVTWNDTASTSAFLLTGTTSVFGEFAFADSHLPSLTLGESKPFAIPACSPLPYRD